MHLSHGIYSDYSLLTHIQPDWINNLSASGQLVVLTYLTDQPQNAILLRADIHICSIGNRQIVVDYQWSMSTSAAVLPSIRLFINFRGRLKEV